MTSTMKGPESGSFEGILQDLELIQKQMGKEIAQLMSKLAPTGVGFWECKVPTTSGLLAVQTYFGRNDLKGRRVTDLHIVSAVESERYTQFGLQDGVISSIRSANEQSQIGPNSLAEVRDYLRDLR